MKDIAGRAIKVKFGSSKRHSIVARRLRDFVSSMISYLYNVTSNKD